MKRHHLLWVVATVALLAACESDTDIGATVEAAVSATVEAQPIAAPTTDSQWGAAETVARLREWLEQEGDRDLEERGELIRNTWSLPCDPADSTCALLTQAMPIALENWDRRSHAAMEPRYLGKGAWEVTLTLLLLTGETRADGMTTLVEEDWIIFESGGASPHLVATRDLPTPTAAPSAMPTPGRAEGAG